MGIATGNPSWQNFPVTSTPLSAEALNKIEDTLDDFMLNGGTPGEPGEDGQDAEIPFYPNKASFPTIGKANTLYVAINPD